MRQLSEAYLLVQSKISRIGQSYQDMFSVIQSAGNMNRMLRLLYGNESCSRKTKEKLTNNRFHLIKAFRASLEDYLWREFDKRKINFISDFTLNDDGQIAFYLNKSISINFEMGEQKYCALVQIVPSFMSKKETKIITPLRLRQNEVARVTVYIDAIYSVDNPLIAFTNPKLRYQVRSKKDEIVMRVNDALKLLNVRKVKIGFLNVKAKERLVYQYMIYQPEQFNQILAQTAPKHQVEGWQMLFPWTSANALYRAVRAKYEADIPWVTQKELTLHEKIKSESLLVQNKALVNDSLKNQLTKRVKNFETEISWIVTDLLGYPSITWEDWKIR